MLAVPFADVLDRLIDARPGPSSTVATASILTAPLLAGAQNYGFTGSRVHRFTGSRVDAPVRPRRRLSPAQRDALECLRSAGADLPDDYLVSELKAAFRTLAKHLHPDMHPAVGEFERHQLAEEFASARDAYDLLLRGPQSS